MVRHNLRALLMLRISLAVVPLLGIVWSGGCHSSSKPIVEPAPSDGSAVASAVPVPAKPLPTTPATKQPNAPTGTCAGLEPHKCAQTAGCILEQPQYNVLLCRAAENRCEASVRHADIIGTDADPQVTQAMTDAAETACGATKGCAVSEGKCSCSCAILGHCNCSCGGSFLRRCVDQADLEIFNGRPAAAYTGTLEPWGSALVAVRRATNQSGFVVDPLPDPKLLIGKNRNEIDSTLGTGRTCVGAGLPSSPCQQAKQIFYALYKLESNNVGGGPELLITFDGDTGRTCTDARIIRTK